MDRFRALGRGRRGAGEEPPEDGYQGAYIAELARRAGRSRCRAMLERIEATLERFRDPLRLVGARRASSSRRSSTRSCADSPTYEPEGTLWVRSTDFGDDKDRSLLRSAEQGSLPTYYAADIAYLRRQARARLRPGDLRARRRPPRRTSRWLKAAARMLGYDPDRVEVLLYQLVHLTRGGEQAKMSKRRGDVVFLDDFIDEVGVDFARWFLVDRGHDQTIEIDVDLAAEKSRKNPVYYVQYVHARISGIFREAPAGAEVDPVPRLPLAPEERELVKRLAEFPGVVREATERRGPHAIPVYAIRLADDFHRFYHEHVVLAVEGRRARVVPARAVARDARRGRPLRSTSSASTPRSGCRCPSGSPRPTVDRVGRNAAEDDRGVRRPREHGRGRRQHRADAEPAGLGGAGADARVRRVHARARRAARRRARRRPARGARRRGRPHAAGRAGPLHDARARRRRVRRRLPAGVLAGHRSPRRTEPPSRPGTRSACRPRRAGSRQRSRSPRRRRTPAGARCAPFASHRSAEGQSSRP